MLILNLYNVDFYLFEGQWMCVCYTGAGLWCIMYSSAWSVSSIFEFEIVS
jgi:hypothetical protein